MHGKQLEMQVVNLMMIYGMRLMRLAKNSMRNVMNSMKNCMLNMMKNMQKNKL